MQNTRKTKVKIYLKKINQLFETKLIQGILPADLQLATLEIAPYLIDGFGNRHAK